MTRAAGIHNPYKEEIPEEKKPDFIQDNVGEDFDSESVTIPPSVTLDGGKYGIEITGVDTPEGAGDKLLTLLYALDVHQRRRMRQFGVTILPPDSIDHYQMPPDELMLKMENRAVTVYVGTDYVDETPVYKRLGHALLNLGASALLKTHKIRVYERG